VRKPESDECSRQRVLLCLLVRVFELLLQQLQPHQQHIACVTLAGTFLTPAAPAAAAAAAVSSSWSMATAAAAAGRISNATVGAPCLAVVLLCAVAVGKAFIWQLACSYNWQQRPISNSCMAMLLLLLVQLPLLNVFQLPLLLLGIGL
jgi:hypothetical protein